LAMAACNTVFDQLKAHYFNLNPTIAQLTAPCMLGVNRGWRTSSNTTCKDKVAQRHKPAAMIWRPGLWGSLGVVCVSSMKRIITTKWVYCNFVYYIVAISWGTKRSTLRNGDIGMRAAAVGHVRSVLTLMRQRYA
jgi:hypothetical protein